MRNLLRKVFIVGGFDQPKQDGAAPVRRTRIPLSEFRVAINMMSGAEPLDAEEVECYLANMIYKVPTYLPHPANHYRAHAHCQLVSVCICVCVHVQDKTLTNAELDERVHIKTARHGCFIEERKCLSWNRCLARTRIYGSVQCYVSARTASHALRLCNTTDSACK